mgnify:CR=1 FL=1
MLGGEDAWMIGGLGRLVGLEAWFHWLGGLVSLEGLLAWRLGEVVSHARRSGEVGGLVKTL